MSQEWVQNAARRIDNLDANRHGFQNRVEAIIEEEFARLSAPVAAPPLATEPTLTELTEWDYDYPRNNKFEDWPLPVAASASPSSAQPTNNEKGTSMIYPSFREVGQASEHNPTARLCWMALARLTSTVDSARTPDEVFANLVKTAEEVYSPRATPERKERRGERRQHRESGPYLRTFGGMQHQAYILNDKTEWDNRRGRDRRQSVGPEEESKC